MLKRSLLLVGIITVVLLGWTNNAFAQSPGTCTSNLDVDQNDCRTAINRCEVGFIPLPSGNARDGCSCSCVRDTDPRVQCGAAGQLCCTDGQYSTNGGCSSGLNCYVAGGTQRCTNTNNLNASPTPVPFDICKAVQGNNYNTCDECIENEGVWTAVGCIHFDPRTFVTDFLKIAMGIAGGIALLLMVYGAFQISVSAGDPKKAEEGREMITGTIAGLLFIIFSIVLLRVIGIDILQIPGLR